MLSRRYKIFTALCWLPLAGLVIFFYFYLLGLSGHANIDSPKILPYVIIGVIVGMPILGGVLFVLERRKQDISNWWQLPAWISSVPLLLWIGVLIAKS